MVAINRKERALQIRTASLEVIRTQGVMTEMRGLPGRIAAASLGDLEMLHRTPFQRLRASAESIMYTRALLRQRGHKSSANLGYGLDIWNAHGKVFNFEWSMDDAELHLVAFKRGPWEDALLNSVSPAAAHQRLLHHSTLSL